MRFLVVVTYCNAFNVWPKTTLLFPVWPREAKRLDTPEGFHAGIYSPIFYTSPIRVFYLMHRESLSSWLPSHAPPTSPWHQSTTTCGHPQPLSSSSTQAEEELSLDTSSACSKAQRLYFMESETRVPLISNSIYRQGTLALRLREGEGPGQRLTGSLLEPESHFSDGLSNDLSIFF